MNKTFTNLFAASGLAAFFALSGCDSNNPEPASPNAGNTNVTSKTFKNSERFVRFDDDKRAGHPDQLSFYRKDGNKWVPFIGVTENDIDPKAAEKSAQNFLNTNKFSWDSKGAALTINAVPDALPTVDVKPLPASDLDLSDPS